MKKTGQNKNNEKVSRDELMGLIKEGKSLKEILELTDDDLNALMFIGYELFNQGNYEDSKVVFKGLESLGHEDPFICTALGTLAARDDDLVKAEEYFGRALDLDPEDVVALTNRAEVYLKKNQFEEAAADLQRAVELDREESSSLGSRARVLAMVTHELMESIQQTA